MTTPAGPMLSVVIPSYNGRPLLETCLASIARHRPAEIAIEVIVADDGSTDDTAGWLTREHPDVRLVRHDQNRGFVAAANAGIAAARGEFIQLLNNDAEVTEGWAETGLSPFTDPCVGSVAPLVLVRSGPSRVDSAGDAYALVGWPHKRGHGEPVANWADHPGDRAFGASGSSAFYRASALRRVGLFDPTFGAYYEDIDLAFRLRWAGYECVFAPRCRILHDISASYDHARPELQRLMARNAEILFWGDLPAPLLALAFWPHVGFTLLQMMTRLAQGRLRPFLLGKLDALKDRSAWRARRALRLDLANSAISRPHFPLSLLSLREVRNHRSRPRKTAWQANAVGRELPGRGGASA